MKFDKNDQDRRRTHFLFQEWGGINLTAEPDSDTTSRREKSYY